MKKNINFNKKIDEKFKAAKKDTCKFFAILILSKTIILKSLAEH